MDAVIVARGCLYLGTEIADSPCSWCAGNMSTPVDRRHLLPGQSKTLSRGMGGWVDWCLSPPPGVARERECTSFEGVLISVVAPSPPSLLHRPPSPPSPPLLPLLVLL